MILALLLDLSNIVGGFLLAIALFRRTPRVGDDLGRAAAWIARFGWIVGVVALATGTVYLLIHLTGGPRVFHFELVGIAVGVLLLWDRFRGRSERPVDQRGAVSGAGLAVAVFGVVAIIVGLQGLVTSDG